MELAIIPPSLKFNNVLNSVRINHPYVEEIAWVDRNDEAIILLQQIDTLQGRELVEYANSLPNSKLNLLFHALKKDITQDQKEKLFIILSSRMKKRFYKYNWIMLQEHYTNANLRESFALISDYIKDNVPTIYDLSLASKMNFYDEKLVEQALNVLKAEGDILINFYARYNIRKESSFAKAISQEFFMHCNSDGFHKNSRLFLDEIQETSKSHCPYISHYLEVMTVNDYVEDINIYLLSLYNSPDKSCGIWDSISKELKTKLEEWTKLKDIGMYMGNHSEKFFFWKNYYQAIEKTKWCPELQLLFLYLPGYVVVDSEDKEYASYLYKEIAFNRTFRSHNDEIDLVNQASWSLDPDSVVSIKDAILENKRSEIYELNYEGIDKLYIRDYLDMIL
ncbi:MAG: hypothetical protein GX783_04605 [Clostridiales bacterium]|nr:hypothetical protein [Clostridiales bacterium]